MQQTMVHEKFVEEARVIKIIREGEKEYKLGKLKPIHALSDLDK